VSRDERALEASGLSLPAAPDALVHGAMELLGLMPNASNYTFLARCSSGADELLAIYKPRRGEIPLWDFPAGTLHRREVAAYEVARSLGWPNVPPTVLREGPEGEGSAQLFVDAHPGEHYFTLQPDRSDDFRRVALFDLIVNNADRKGGHCLLDDKGTVWVIDHGVCFSDEPKLRTVIWEYADEPIPRPLRADLDRAREALAPGGPLRARLVTLIDPSEIRATEARLDALVRRERFPRPGPGRPYPWPPI
jgi:hypothetical protein